ncbi:hypothetical protein D3C75_751610 [compost metagenome]
MAYACSRFNDGHRGIHHNVLDQRAPAARDNDIQQSIQLQHFIHGGTVRIFDQLQRLAWNSRFGKCPVQHLDNFAVG